MRLIIYFLSLIIISSSSNGQLLDWFWKKNEEQSVVVADGVPLLSIPFESMTQDEKFLQEAAKFTEIQATSPLEICQHKVIMKIRTSCNGLSEEELAKLSVNLLNCQSAIEGRKMFPCTEEMTLKQCTTEMDADMWNTYHLISNRARAVCYASRGTQFRALAELTVNKLMQTAHSQIKTLHSLKESQDRLEEQTVGALNSLNKGNEALLDQQKDLKNAQTLASGLLSVNLRQLNNEKALIRTGHVQLVTMTEDIKNKLEKANEEHQESHQEIMKNLTHIQKQAFVLFDKIEKSTHRIISQNREAAEQYEQTLKKLEQINATVNFVWNVTNTMHAELDQQLAWITNYIGNTGEKIQKVYHVFVHMCYMILAMIISAFLQAPVSSRVAIVILVPLNLVTFWKHGLDSSLDLISITALVLLITGLYFVMRGLRYFIGLKITSNSMKTERENIETTNSKVSKFKIYRQYVLRKIVHFWHCLVNEHRYQRDNLRRIYESVTFWKKQEIESQDTQFRSCSYIPARKIQDSLLSDDLEPSFDLANDLSDSSDSFNGNDNYSETYSQFRIKEHDPVSSSVRRKLRSRSPSLSSKRKCFASTKNGKPCKFGAVKSSSFCHLHLAHTSTISTT